MNAKLKLIGFHLVFFTAMILLNAGCQQQARDVSGFGGLEKIGYEGAVSIESFTPENKELAGAVCIWKKLAENQDEFAVNGLKFLQKLFN